MNIDDRIEPSTMNLGLLTRDVQNLKAAGQQDGEHIRLLAQNAQKHEELFGEIARRFRDTPQSIARLALVPRQHQEAALDGVARNACPHDSRAAACAPPREAHLLA